MKYLSVCSGIESATCAWHPLGWEPVGFSEIDPFPRSVLTHHYPDVPLFGDFTEIQADDIERPQGIVGGTPCQDFSIGGGGASWDGERGGLSWRYVELVQRIMPDWFVWENVRNALQGKHRQGFCEFIKRLMQLGYCVAWRVLDARYFATAQQRSRVFVVGTLGNTSSGKILFESQGVRGIDSQADPPTVSVCLTARGVGSLDDRELYVEQSGRIRHITPLEAERIMGFPDNYTYVPHKGKPAFDTPRYRAIGNSMAVNVMSFLGQRIQAVAGNLPNGGVK